MLGPRRNGSTLRGLAAGALGAAALLAPAAALADDAQVESGFVLQTNLGLRANILNVTSPSLNGNGTNAVGLPANNFDAQLFGGYKMGRVIIGLGIEFMNMTEHAGATVAGTNESATATHSAFLIGPEVMFAILRSPDNRVELFGDLALHFGHEFADVSTTPAQPATNAPTPSNFLLTYQLGPGVRFWAHKHFAIQGTTGFAGSLYHYIPASNDTNNTTFNLSSHGIFGSFGMLGAF